MSLKFCANLSFMFQEESNLLKRYALASKCGFKGVECAFPYEFSIEEVVRAKEAAGVKQVLINTPVMDGGEGKLGLAALPGKEKEFIDGVRKAVEYAKALDCRLIHIMSGGVLRGREEEHMATYKRNLGEAVSLLKAENMVALIEPINGFTVPNYFMNNYDKALNVITSSNAPNLKLMLDVFHLQQIQGNLTRSLKRFLDCVGHVQIAQVPDRHEPDSTGEIDYKYFLDLLKTENYQGWIGLEYKPFGSTEKGLSWISDFGYKL